MYFRSFPQDMDFDPSSCDKTNRKTRTILPNDNTFSRSLIESNVSPDFIYMTEKNPHILLYLIEDIVKNDRQLIEAYNPNILGDFSTFFNILFNYSIIRNYPNEVSNQIRKDITTKFNSIFTEIVTYLNITKDTSLNLNGISFTRKQIMSLIASGLFLNKIDNYSGKEYVTLFNEMPNNHHLKAFLFQQLAKNNLSNLIPIKDLRYLLIYRSQFSYSCIHDIIAGLNNDLIEETAQILYFIAEHEQMYHDLIYTLFSEHLSSLIYFPQIITKAVQFSKNEISNDEWMEIIKLGPGTFDSGFLLSKNRPNFAGLILQGDIEKHFNEDSIIEILNHFQNDEKYMKCFFDKWTVTNGNKEIYNSEKILIKLSEIFNEQKFDINIDNLNLIDVNSFAKIVVKNSVTNLDLLMKLIRPGFSEWMLLLQYFNQNEAKIKSNPESLACSIPTEEFHVLCSNYEENKNIYHTLIHFYVIRKCLYKDIETNFEKIYVPLIKDISKETYDQLGDLFYDIWNKDIEDKIRSLSPQAKNIFYAGLALNTSFDGNFEWRYTEVDSQLFMILLCCSIIPVSYTAVHQKTPFIFLTEDAAKYVCVVPDMTWLRAYNNVVDVFTARCTNIFDICSSTYQVLTAIEDVFLSQEGSFPQCILKFLIKEMEILKLNSQFAQTISELIRFRLANHGSEILEMMASNVSYLESESLFEVLDLSIFPLATVIKFAAKSLASPNKNIEFRTRAINSLFKPTPGVFSELTSCIKRQNAHGIYNIASYLSYWKEASALQLVLRVEHIPSIDVLAMTSLRSVVMGEYLLENVGTNRMIDCFVDVLLRYPQDNIEVTRILQNALIKSTIGFPMIAFEYHKYSLELPYISTPITAFIPFYYREKDIRNIAMAVKLCYVRVNEKILVKRDWHNFQTPCKGTTKFIEKLFFSIVNINNPQSIALLSVLINMRYWYFSYFTKSPLDVLNALLNQVEPLSKAEANPNYGIVSLNYTFFINRLIHETKYRKSFFMEILPSIGSRSVSQQIVIGLIMLHSLLNPNLQFLTFMFMQHNIQAIAPVMLMCPNIISNVERRRLIVGLRLMAAYFDIQSKVTVEMRKVMQLLLEMPPYLFQLYSSQQTKDDKFCDLIEKEILSAVFCIEKVPNSKELIPGRRKNKKFPRNFEKYLPHITKSLEMEGIQKHLPTMVQIRLANKTLPPFPKDLDPIRRVALLCHNEFAYRVIYSDRIYFLLPDQVKAVKDAIDAINEIKETREVKPAIDRSPFITLSILPNILNMWSNNHLVDSLIEFLTVKVIKSQTNDFISQFENCNKLQAIVGVCSIIKHHSELMNDEICEFLCNLLEKFAIPLAKKGSYKLVYSILSVIGHKNDKSIDLIQDMLNQKSSYTFYRGVKLLKKLEINSDEILNKCFQRAISNPKSDELMTLIEFFPNIAIQNKSFVCQKIPGLIGKENKALECSLYVDTLANSFELEKASAELLKEKDPEFWGAVIPGVEWMWEIRRKSNLFTFLDHCMRLVSLQKRMEPVRENIDNLINKEIFVMISITHENIFKNSMLLISDRMTKKEIARSNIKIKFPEMKVPEAGGVLRGWFTACRDDMLSSTDLFVPSSDHTCYIINPLNTDYKLYQSTGMFLALSILHKEVVNLQLSQSTLKLLLNRTPQFSDLADAYPHVSKFLMDVMNEETDPADLCMMFNTQLDEDHLFELKEGGNDIELTADNRKEYVSLMSDFYLRRSVEKQIYYLRKGFTNVLPLDLFNSLTATEFSMLICGSPTIDVEEFISSLILIPPLTPEHPVTKMFFDVIRGWDNEKLSNLLLFMTSSPVIPVGGFETLKAQGRQPKLKLAPLSYLSRGLPLPVALTCFSHITLPAYESKEDMERALTIAITESDGYV